MKLPSGALARPGAGPSDAVLVGAAREGDAWAQEALYRRHARMAIGLAHRLMPHDADVDDLVPELPRIGDEAGPFGRHAIVRQIAELDARALP